MDSSGGFGRVMNESFTVALSPADDSWKDGTFHNVFANGMVLNPNRKWEAALVECHIPRLIHLTQPYNEERFFQFGFYRACDFTTGDADSEGCARPESKVFAEKHFYNPKDGETDFHSFATALHKTLDSDTYLGPFTYHKYERHIRVGMSEDGHAIITIVRPIDKNDIIAFRAGEFRLTFGNGWYQIWKGRVLYPKPGFEGVGTYSYYTDTVEIQYEFDDGEQIPKEVTDAKLVGLVLKSASKWDGGKEKDPLTGLDPKHSKTPMIIRCDFLKSNTLAGVSEGMPTIGIASPGRYETKQLKYVPVESNNLKTVRVDILDIVTRLNVMFDSKLVEKPYIIIKFRPI